MGGPSDVVAEALEANRIKEALLSQHARLLGRLAAQVAETVRTGRAVHVLADGPRAALAAYLAEALFRAGVAARPLPPGDDGDLVRAVDAFVQAGDLVLLMVHEAWPGLDRAALRARARGATCAGLLGQPAAATLAPHCDLPVGVPTSRPNVAAEVFLAAGHLLVGLVGNGKSVGGSSEAERLAPAPSADAAAPLGGPPPRPAPLPPIEPPRERALQPSSVAESGLGVGVPSAVGTRITDLGVIDEDPLASADELDDDEPTDEAMLLAEAVEGLAAPPTDPRGLRPRRKTEQLQPRAAARPALAPGLLRFRCGGCEEPIVVEERHAGRRGQCPHCRAEFIIPKPQVDLTATQRAPVVTQKQAQAAAQAQTAAAQAQQRSSPGRVAAQAPGGGKERRRAARITVKDALVRFARNDFPAPGAYHEPSTLEDLSLTGMRFVGRSRDVAVGDVMFFTLDFPAFPEPLRVKGEVRRVMKLKGEAGAAVGVRFVQYHGDAEAKVRRLLEQPALRTVRRR